MASANSSLSPALQEQLKNLVLFRIDYRLDDTFYALVSEQKQKDGKNNLYNALSHKLKDIKDKSKNTFTEITALDLNGKIIASSDYENVSHSVSEEVWKNLKKKQDFHVSKVSYNNKTNLLGNRVYIPLHNEKFMGYLSVGVDAYYLDLVEYFMEQ